LDRVIIRKFQKIEPNKIKNIFISLFLVWFISVFCAFSLIISSVYDNRKNFLFLHITLF